MRIVVNIDDYVEKNFNGWVNENHPSIMVKWDDQTAEYQDYLPFTQFVRFIAEELGKDPLELFFEVCFPYFNQSTRGWEDDES